jgi:ppGpp synthetase/RelA/SpoT-type nucleotidyltranferase
LGKYPRTVEDVITSPDWIDTIPEGQEVDWAKPGYSRSQVDKAGDRLAKGQCSPQELAAAVEVMNNWRASHSYPLNTFQMTLRNRAKAIYEHANVVQRLKRATSIEGKLKLIPGMKLSRMQDIGGCRAIVTSVPLVDRLAEKYKSSDYHEFVREFDYLRGPKVTGYRGIHLVYRYRADTEPFQVYEGLSLEIQLRTTHQHSWATAVEVVDTLTGQDLKSGHDGDPRWKRFFALMGTVLADLEGTEPVPDTPTDRGILRAELTDLAQDLKAVEVLNAARATINGPPGHEKVSDLFLLKLDYAAHEVHYWGYLKNQIRVATRHLASLEEEVRQRPMLNVVLVGAADLRAVRRAYPNYFMDTDRFIQEVKRALVA